MGLLSIARAFLMHGAVEILQPQHFSTIVQLSTIFVASMNGHIEKTNSSQSNEDSRGQRSHMAVRFKTLRLSLCKRRRNNSCKTNASFDRHQRNAVTPYS